MNGTSVATRILVGILGIVLLLFAVGGLGGQSWTYRPQTFIASGILVLIGGVVYVIMRAIRRSNGS